MALIQEYNKLLKYNNQLANPNINITKIYVNGSRVWPAVMPTPPTPGPDYTEPFYVENISNNVETLSIVKNNSNAPTLEIEYSTDKITWTPFENPTSTTPLTLDLQPSDKVYLRCNTNIWSSGLRPNIITGISKVGGNIMSLLRGSSFTGQETNFPDSTLNRIFYSLFKGNTNLRDASSLLLPATTLATLCYEQMFQNCTSLTQAPALPATTLAEKCYSSMFYGCTSLTTAPALPATTLATYCYQQMFQNCTSLTQAPALPATTLATYCYNGMFQNCTSLTTAPVLSATILVQGCYSGMFRNCRLLNEIKCLATDISTPGITVAWLFSVSATGTFTKAAGVTWPEGVSGIPSGWTVVEV